MLQPFFNVLTWAGVVPSSSTLHRGILDRTAKPSLAATLGP
jgi:hypothetical protein